MTPQFDSANKGANVILSAEGGGAFSVDDVTGTIRTGAMRKYFMAALGVFAALALFPASAFAAACTLATIVVGPPKVVVCTDTSATTITVPSDWNSASNTIWAIGGGSGGVDTVSATMSA